MMANCASAPEFDADLPQVSITKAPQAELKTFGGSNMDNPFLEPTSIFRGKLFEFIVYKVAFNLPSDAKVSVMTEAKNLESAIIAIMYDSDSLMAFWGSMAQSDDGRNIEAERKVATIKSVCIPASDFIQKAGQKTYYLPFIAQNPIQKPSTIYIQIVVGNSEPVIFAEKLL